ncbi:MAG TPA: hypothetical protein VK557_06110 [Pyrinomonadaceae bacterium]|nr:hypothetical protein [Pyrinomonadaceae bacterium]
MKKFLFLLSALALVTGGCAQKPADNTAASSTPKPAASTTSAAPKANEKKAPSTNPVPSDWVRMYNDAKGYEFYVPAGTKDSSQNVDGVDVYMAGVPAPYEIGVMVIAFKDKSLSKDDLMKRAENVLKSMDEKDIKIDAANELSADYSLATFVSTGKDGKVGKGKILVGTDVTDNYIIIVGGDADKFGANEKTIDEIWGSFGMYSGGASGNS